MKTKFVAVILLLLLGALGAHRFYLNQPLWGLAYILVFIISVLFIMYGIGIFGLIALGIVVIIDLFNILLMKNEVFNAKYNKDLPPK